MKNYRVILTLLLALLVLVGCEKTQQETSQPSETTVEPSASVQETLSYEELYITPPEKPGNGLVEYDPDRRVYITAGDTAVTIFSSEEQGWYHNVFLIIMSKEPLPLEEIVYDPSRTGLSSLDNLRIQVPVPCTTEILECRQFQIIRETEWSYGEANTVTMPFYLYQAYRGVDFTDEGSSSAVQTDFTRLQPEHLPEFYAYNVVVNLHGEAVTERTELEYVDVELNGETHRVFLGEVILYPPEDKIYDLDLDYLDAIPLSGAGSFGQMYSDGYGTSLILDMTADRDLVIERVELCTPGTEVLDWVVSKSGSPTFSWDGSSPIELFKGDFIRIEVYFRTTALSGDWVSKWHLKAEFFCTSGDEECRIHTETRNTTGINMYEMYAIVFDGVDMEPYYRDYYYDHYDLWIKNYKEE